MKKVLVVGHGPELAIALARVSAELGKDVEIECVETSKDIPSPRTFEPEPFMLNCAPRYIDLPVIKRKGHERPYKYHR